MEKLKKDKTKHDDNSRYKDSKLSIFPLIESIKIYISKSYRNFKADDNRSFTQSYFSDAIKLLLDTYPNASAAYSLRKLSSSYQGPAIRVRRSSDNQEQDIYFDSLSNLDTNSLTSFVGSQNLFLQSQEFDTAAWIKVDATVVQNATTDPLGGNTADKIIPAAGASAGQARTAVIVNIVAGQTYTWSVYLKAAEFQYVSIVPWTSDDPAVVFNLSNGTIVNTTGPATTPAIESVGNDWYRVSVTRVASSSSALIRIIPWGNPNSQAGNGTSGIFAWGAQLNSGTLQPYVATTTTARSGDGFVTTWYDQSGNSRNATQSTAASQPRIVSAGIYEIENGKTAINFLENVSTYLTTSNFSLISQPATSISVVKNLASVNFQVIHAGATSNRIDVGANSNLLYGFSTQLGTTTLSIANQYALVTMIANGANSTIYKNNSSQSVSIGSGQMESIRIGESQGLNAGWKGKIQELIMYPYNQVGNIDSISSNINQYYSIY